MDNRNSWVNMRELLEQIQIGNGNSVRIKTGFPQLDELLGGGLAPGLVVLGGQPGVGKSTFCLQLAENVAESGIPVLYFSFEMQERQIAAKAISRKLFLNGSLITAEQLLGGDGGKPLDQEQRKLVEQVKGAEEFLQVMENFYVRTSPRPVSEIKKAVLEFAEEYWTEGESKPLVIVDYLQFVPTEKDAKFKSDKEKNDDKVRQFTQLAHEDEFTVILISSLNRGSYSGDMQISAFKETGEIEYSADLLLGLQFQSYGKRMNSLKELAKDPREVKISVLKNRYGKSGCMVPFAYYAAHDCFREKTFREAREPEPAVVVQEKAKEEKKRTGQRCVINNTLVAEKIRQGGFARQSCKVLPEKDGRKAVSIQYELSENLSSLDCCVADAIYTVAIRLWEDGIPEKDALLTPRDLMKALSGDPRPTITAQKLQELTGSIKHLQAVSFKFDCAEALKVLGNDGIGPDKLREYDGPFLNVRIEEQGEEAADAPAGRKRLDVWDTGDGKKLKISFQTGVLPLFLHSYGAAVNQIITVPSNLLNVNDGTRNLSNTAENLCLKRLLAQRIEILRYKAERKEAAGKLSTISFHEKRRLLSELQHSQKGLSNTALEQRRRRLHDAVRQVLEYYKRIQYISGYEELSKTGYTNLASFKVIGPFKDPLDLSY